MVTYMARLTDRNGYPVQFSGGTLSTKHVRSFTLAAALLALLTLIGAPGIAMAAPSVSPVHLVDAAGQVQVVRLSDGFSATTVGVSPNGGFTCHSNGIQASWTSPNPRLVSWSEQENCTVFIFQMFYEQSTLFFDTGGQSFPIAEGTHSNVSPAAQASTVGSASNSQLFPGSYHVHTMYILQLFGSQGPWTNLSPNCTGVGTNVATYNDNTGEFQLN